MWCMSISTLLFSLFVHFFLHIIVNWEKFFGLCQWTAFAIQHEINFDDDQNTKFWFQLLKKSSIRISSCLLFLEKNMSLKIISRNENQQKVLNLFISFHILNNFASTRKMGAQCLFTRYDVPFLIVWLIKTSKNTRREKERERESEEESAMTQCYTYQEIPKIHRSGC